MDKQKSTGSNLVRVLAIVAIVAAAGVFAYRNLTQTATTAPVVNTDPSVVETIFMPLAREVVAIPATTSGTGGGLTDWAGTAVLVTNAGEFYAIADGAATKLEIDAPENGIEDYAAFVEALEREPALFWFRYNDILVDPRLGDQVFVSFTRWKSAENCYTNAIASAPINPAVPGEVTGPWKTLFEANPCLEIAPFGRPLQGHMAGARMAVTADNQIVLASGDYARDGNYDEIIVAQDPAAEYGKIVQINPESGASRILSMGHSNTQGVAVDAEGNIWNVEHGRRGGDELNLIRPGLNYGWPNTSLGTRYNKLTLPTVEESGVHSDRYEAPVRAWLPSVAPGGLTVIQGFNPLWDGDLLMATLGNEALFRIRIRDGRVLFDERIPVGQRVRYVQMMSDGRIALYTDAKTVEFLTVGQTNFAYEIAEAYAENIDNTTERAEFLATVDTCMMCHSLGQISGEGPRALGRVIDHPFSDGVATNYTGNAEPTWTRSALTAYLADPDSFAPDTSMPDPQLEEGEKLTHLVNLLAILSRNPE